MKCKVIKFGKTEYLEVNVVDMNQTHILSAETCENLVTDYQCSPQADNITIKASVQKQILDEFKNVFEGLS